MATTKVSKGLIKDGAVTIEKLNNELVVKETEGIINHDNDNTVPTSAAVKDYVDASIVGGLFYQGSYDASANQPALDNRSNHIAVKKGFTYTVTFDGTFYGEVVRVGDVLIAEIDLPAGTIGALENWTIVQSNVDLAGDGTVNDAVRGLAAFDESVFTTEGGWVKLKNGTADSQILSYANDSQEWFISSSLNDLTFDDHIHVKNYIELGDESLGGSNYLFKRNPFNLGFDLRLNDVSLQPLWEILTVNSNESTTKFNTDVEIASGKKLTVDEPGIYTTAPTLNLRAGTFIYGGVEAVGILTVKDTLPGTTANRSTDIGAGQIFIKGDGFNEPAINFRNFFQPTSEVRLEVDDSATLRILKPGGTADVSISGDLFVTGNVYAQGDVVAFSSSDKRLKDNIKPIDSALDKVCKLGGYEFDWNDKQDVYEGHDIGVIAQEVEAVFPELVTDRNNGFKAVKYEKLVPALIEAIKEQQEQINELKTRLDGITN